MICFFFAAATHDFSFSRFSGGGSTGISLESIPAASSDSGERDGSRRSRIAFRIANIACYQNGVFSDS
ncbi:hypothetical protein F2Q69_00024811 [Brassica cretica]|uniref:Uncharacterized protein n=1 Tax=Brassica cretica TaxID=69181 RepID=A0A8S9QGV8_BRACR|nr:hypothetical protein F2Q69_00024811 [Brassica cretica]